MTVCITLASPTTRLAHPAIALYIATQSWQLRAAPQPSHAEIEFKIAARGAFNELDASLNQVAPGPGGRGINRLWLNLIRSVLPFSIFSPSSNRCSNCSVEGASLTLMEAVQPCLEQ